MLLGMRGQCFKCHRFRNEGGDTGPDLTGVGNRFDTRYILESIILPSRAFTRALRLSLIKPCVCALAGAKRSCSSPRTASLRGSRF